ncbi:hypothetical protein AALO_G00032530 [Alosa alosa]|uniref:Protein kinase domain-containing protein n=1 Tax=Alosa alosa TaxID=278164 RepID=A0AAV6HGA7_9TELE|nr:hypothetical protein AALO_G00032530 [Alosa alosa]
MVKFDLPLSSPASPAAERQRRKEWLIIEFLNSCMSQMQSLVQQRLPGETRSTPSSSKMLLRPPSLKDLLKPGGSDLCLSKKSSSRSGPWGSVQCFGFGKLCVERRGQLVGLQACIPLVSDVELTLQEDEPPTDFTLGDHTHMSNSSWRGCRVTVKDLLPQSGSEVGRLHSYRDVLQREQDYCSRLLHPHLLQLLAVALGSDLHTRLVFERREALPVLPVEGMLGVLLQVCEALLYLHTCKLVLRSLSSHSVLMVRPTLAKLTSLGFITSVDGSVSPCGSPPPLPAALMNWAAPEVVKQQLCTEKADIYSMCALIQEIYTDALPWGCLSPGDPAELMRAGPLPPPLPRSPYYQLLQHGLQPQAQQRTHTLQQLRYTLHTHSKELSDVTSGMSPATKKQQESFNQSCAGRRSLDSEIQHQLSQLDHILQREEQRGREENQHVCSGQEEKQQRERGRGGGEERREEERRGERGRREGRRGESACM